MLRWRQEEAGGSFNTAARERPPREVTTPTVATVDPPPFIHAFKTRWDQGQTSRRRILRRSYLKNTAAL